MVAAREAMDKVVVVVGILPMGEITKTTGLTKTRGAATTPTVRATPVMTGEIQGTSPN